MDAFCSISSGKSRGVLVAFELRHADGVVPVIVDDGQISADSGRSRRRTGTGSDYLPRYTRFDYGEFKFNPCAFAPGGAVTVTVTVDRLILQRIRRRFPKPAPGCSGSGFGTVGRRERSFCAAVRKQFRLSWLRKRKP